ncbi:S-adenosyl-L-methionine-dependent methyltransferase [Xylariomycetidae sp. FL0641]|nr:S-adenosyl-L-methionine-dependent methyltransferase [Xylariomycetidae sp. FL0641]
MAALDSITPSDFEGNHTDRLRCVEAARKLINRLQSSDEKMYDIGFSQPVVFAAIQTCHDLGIWENWRAAGVGAQTVDEICKLAKTGCDPKLLSRLLRLLASVGVIEEAGEDCYKPSVLSLDLGDKDSFSYNSIQARTDHWQVGATNLPKYLAKIGYREPTDTVNSNYADGCPEKLSFFERATAYPAYHDSFSGFMRTWGSLKRPWPEFYDTAGLVEGADLSQGNVLCVDIGGHTGIDLTRLAGKHPDIPDGSLVLQDLPDVLTGAKGLSGKIKPMPHDMFTPQPVKGSRAYYFHAVFHDWPDAKAIEILKNAAAAMKPGYSKLLINDIVLPPTGCSSVQATMDVEMMSVVAAYERSERTWRSLVGDAGLKIIEIWPDGRGNESLIEAELA